MSKLNKNNNNKDNINSNSNIKNLQNDITKRTILKGKKKSKSKYNNDSSFLCEFKRSKSGIAGVVILLFLIFMTLYAFFGIPFTSFKEWNNPNYWIDNPRIASPVWSNFGGFFSVKTPEHIILSSDIVDSDKYSSASNSDVTISKTKENEINVITHSYSFNYNYDLAPNDFMVTYSLSKEKDPPPVIEIEVLRPDNHKYKIYFDSITQSISDTNQTLTFGRIFSTDDLIHQKLLNYLKIYNYEQDSSRPEIMLFSNQKDKSILKGSYTFNIKFYLFNNEDNILNTKLILGGERFGLMGTDESRRDLIVGLLWGTPVALFIGLSVSTISTAIGIIYGVLAGYKGKRTGEVLMRINDIFIALPVFAILIILILFIGQSIYLIVLFLVLFGWVGLVRISRSMALQIKNFQYIEAAKLIGQSDLKIILKHIIPQLLPFIFANIALSVPAAILTEAGLSFIGLGDPSIPTWGQILHDANLAAAASRGLWWWLIPPGLLIALTGVAFALIGKTIDSILNPEMKTV